MCKTARRFAAAFGMLTAVLAIAGFFIHWKAGVLMLCAAALFGGIFGIFLCRRDASVRHMTEEIDKVLHNADHIYIDGGDEGALSVLQSEIVKMTRRIREQNQALMQEKQHLADSLADIAHQLRTPLTSVNMVLSFLETAQTEAERKELLREADSLLWRMDSLLTVLLKLSRLDAGVVELKQETVSVNALIASALEPLQIPMELLGISVQMQVPPEANLVGDATWLAEALQNILKNGMESAGAQGRIEITCEDTLLYTQLAIRDSGKGFPEDALPHVFERVYRGKHSQNVGFGIGLAMAKTIIDRQGGLITAGNHPAGGAVFTIKFYK